jgi:uncharacterized membrane protein YgdD (TMEM256/DUF423 family)
MSVSAEPSAPPSSWRRTWLCAGALLGFSAVAMAAVAAHLPDRLLVSNGRDMLRGAVQMQGWHALALLAVGVWSERRDGVLLRLAGLAMLAGTLAFCLGVYCIAFAGPPLGRVAPIGGSLTMLGWLLLAAAALRR